MLQKCSFLHASRCLVYKHLDIQFFPRCTMMTRFPDVETEAHNRCAMMTHFPDVETEAP